jgi:hypothetical protein
MLVSMDNKVTQIKHKTVDEYSNYKIDQISSIALYLTAIISLGALCSLFYCYFNCCSKKTTNNNTNILSRYGLNH